MALVVLLHADKIKTCRCGGVGLVVWWCFFKIDFKTNLVVHVTIWFLIFCYLPLLQRLYSHVVEAIQPCCGGYTAMLRRLYSYVAEAIQPCCGGYTAMLQRLYSHVAEAIQPCCGGYTCFFTDYNTTLGLH